MNIKVWYLSYFEGVCHTRMIETFSISNARMAHTMVCYSSTHANVKGHIFSLFRNFSSSL